MNIKVFHKSIVTFPFCIHCTEGTQTHPCQSLALVLLDIYANFPSRINIYEAGPTDMLLLFTFTITAQSKGWAEENTPKEECQ